MPFKFNLQRYSADSPGLEPHELLAPNMLPAWVAAGAGRSSSEAAAASAVAAAGLRALAGHEGSRGEAGLRSLAVLLGAAARLQPRYPWRVPVVGLCKLNAVDQ